jgi:hypothetical protein
MWLILWLRPSDSHLPDIVSIHGRYQLLHVSRSVEFILPYTGVIEITHPSSALSRALVNVGFTPAIYSFNTRSPISTPTLSGHFSSVFLTYLPPHSAQPQLISLLIIPSTLFHIRLAEAHSPLRFFLSLPRSPPRTHREFLSRFWWFDGPKPNSPASAMLVSFSNRRSYRRKWYSFAQRTCISFLESLRQFLRDDTIDRLIHKVRWSGTRATIGQSFDTLAEVHSFNCDDIIFKNKTVYSTIWLPVVTGMIAFQKVPEEWIENAVIGRSGVLRWPENSGKNWNWFESQKVTCIWIVWWNTKRNKEFEFGWTTLQHVQFMKLSILMENMNDGSVMFILKLVTKRKRWDESLRYLTKGPTIWNKASIFQCIAILFSNKGGRCWLRTNCEARVRQI